MAKSIAQLDKEIAYAEGLEAGFAQAQISISEAFNGILTDLNRCVKHGVMNRAGLTRLPLMTW